MAGAASPPMMVPSALGPPKAGGDPSLAPETVVSVQDVSLRFGRHWALAHVSFDLRRADSLLVIGPNGAGKTTLLRLLASAITPTHGRVSGLGLDARTGRDQWRQRVGLLSHANYLYEDLSAEENILLAARVLGLPDPKAAVGRCIERVGLATRAHDLVRTFSAGMRKRVAMARILIKDPEIVLLDEPFGELDPTAMTAMEDFVRDFQQRGRTIALVTHHVEHGRSICNRVLSLKDGRVEKWE